MTPASEIVKRLGGNKTVADWLGLERTAVQRWRYPAPKGLGERIPMRHWARLMDLAKDKQTPLALDELMPDEVASIARTRKRRAA